MSALGQTGNLLGAGGLPWEEIRAAIRAHGDFGGIEFEPLGGWQSTGDVFRAVVEAGEGRSAHFLVKRSQYAHLEARWLETISRRFEGTGLQETVPSLVAHLWPHQVIVTNFQTGAENLGVAILRGAAPGVSLLARPAAVRATRALGEWLGRSQAALTEGEFSFAQVERDINARIDEFAAAGFSRTEALRSALSAAFAAVGPLPAVLSHGDMAPRNVLVARGRIHVVDWEMVPEQPWPFLFDVFHALLVIRKRHPLLKASVQRELGEALLAGYRATTPFQDQLAAAWRPVKLLTLTLVLSRQLRAIGRSPIKARLTGKTVFTAQLKEEINRELDLN